MAGFTVWAQTDIANYTLGSQVTGNAVAIAGTCLTTAGCVGALLCHSRCSSHAIEAHASAMHAGFNSGGYMKVWQADTLAVIGHVVRVTAIHQAAGRL